ncbi:MAG: AAA family ATPase [Methylibium sp.]|nr:AAA family ATPase [Methylibium sp.]
MKFRTDSEPIDPKNPFAQDALDRKPLVEFLEAVIEKIEGPMVLALDSPWGTGKTTLVRMLQAQLEAKQFRCIYFNAWAVDYASDPLVAIVSKIDLLGKDAKPEAQKRMKKLKSIATLVGRRGLIATVKASTLGALDLEKEIEAALADGAGEATSDLFDLAVKEGECLAKFREELQAVIAEIRKKNERGNLIVFIDELDRCRPTFAIELLERIKHLFDVPNIVFVLSIDKSQVEVSTSSVYGVGINAREYLRRFIDLEFQVPQVSGKPFIKHLLKRFELDEVFSERTGDLRSDMSNFVDFFCFLAKTTGMSLRTQEHCVARLALVLDQTPSNYHLHPVLAATLIVTRAMHSQLFSKIRSGAASTEALMEWLRSLDTGCTFKDRASVAIESYMNAADPNETRQAQRRQRLEAQANNSVLDSGERSHASEVLQFTGHLAGSFHGAPSLAYVMNKMDLAENLQP